MSSCLVLKLFVVIKLQICTASSTLACVLAFSQANSPFSIAFHSYLYRFLGGNRPLKSLHNGDLFPICEEKVGVIDQLIVICYTRNAGLALDVDLALVLERGVLKRRASKACALKLKHDPEVRILKKQRDLRVH